MSVLTSMNGNYLLDTSVIIAFLRRDSDVLNQMQKRQSILIPMIAVGELFYGVLKSGYGGKREAHLRQFLASSVVLGGDRETGYWYAFIKNQLRQKGRLIPENDIWIGALGMQYQLIIATRDKHFTEIDGLNVEMW